MRKFLPCYTEAQPRLPLKGLSHGGCLYDHVGPGQVMEVTVSALLGQCVAHSTMFDTVIFQSSLCCRVSLEWLPTCIMQPVLDDDWLWGGMFIHSKLVVIIFRQTNVVLVQYHTEAVRFLCILREWVPWWVRRRPVSREIIYWFPVVAADGWDSATFVQISWARIAKKSRLNPVSYFVQRAPAVL